MSNKRKRKGSGRQLSSKPETIVPSFNNSNNGGQFRQMFFSKQFWIGGIPILAGIATLVFSPYPIFVDIREGKWGGRLSVTIDELALNDKAPTYVLYATPRDHRYGTFVVPTGFTLKNELKSSDKDVSFSIAYRKEYARSLIPKEAMIHNSRRIISDVQTEVVQGTTNDFVNRKITLMSKGEVLHFDDGAFAAPINDDPEMAPMYASHSGMDVVVTTSSEKDIRRDWKINYRGVLADSQAELERYMAEWQAKYIAINIRSNLGFFSYLAKVIWPEDVVFYGVAPQYREVPGSNWFIPVKYPDEYLVMKVQPYHWRNLIQCSVKREWYCSIVSYFDGTKAPT